MIVLRVVNMREIAKVVRGVAFFVAGISSAYSQIIQVIDSESQRPVADVFIFHQNQESASFSDETGKADITGFPIDGKIIIQHPSYDNIELDRPSKDIEKVTVKLNESILNYKGVTVAANKWKQNENEVALDVMSIDAKEITFQNSGTSADLLNNSGKVFVQKSQQGGGSPTLRGFAANAVLIVVDGVRLNNAIYRSGNLQNVINIDPNILDRTEVVFGPGSVIYGSDALGGVMDFRTVNPKWELEGGTTFKANGMLRYASASNERTGHVDLTVSQQNVAYFGSFSRSSFGDLQAGSRRSDKYEGFFERNFYAARRNGQDVLVQNDNPDLERFSGFDLTNVLQKVRWRISDNSSLSYSYFISTTSDIPRYDRLTIPIATGSDSLESAEWYYGPQTWQMHTVKFDSYKSVGLYDQMQVTLAFQNYEESRHDRAFGSNSLRNRKEEVDIITFNNDYEKKLKRGTLYFGIDGFWNNVSSIARTENIVTGEISNASTRYPDDGSQYYSIASYGNYQWNLSKKWILSTGVRYSIVQLDANTLTEDINEVATQNETLAGITSFENLDLTNQALTGSISAVFNPSARTKLSGIVSSGFRSPNVDDVGKLFEIDANTVVIPNSDLKPEYSYNQEFGLEQKISDQVQVNLVGFHSYLTNAIVRGDVEYSGAENLNLDGSTLALRSQVNASRARIYGGSVQLSINFQNDWGLSSTINVNEGKELDTAQPLRHATPVFGRSTLKYNRGNFRSEVFVEYNAGKSKDNIPDSEFLDKPHIYTDFGAPGWATLNLKAGYSLSKNLRVESGLENILDQHYRTYSSGISAPGRNLYLTIRGSL